MPTQRKCPFRNKHLSYRRAHRIFENLPCDQEGIFWEGLKYDVQKFVVECLVLQQYKVERVKTLTP